MKNDTDKSKRDEKEEQIDENSEVEELLEQIEEADNKYKRALADYQNLQRRVADERVEWIRSANKDLLLRILTVLDTLMMASGHIKDQGLTVTINQFFDVLKAEGVTPIKTEGQEFDPHLMEAITSVPGEEGKVVEQVRSGFLIHDKLLRPAQVKVGKVETQ